jgi:hypothetical protein
MVDVQLVSLSEAGSFPLNIDLGHLVSKVV